MQHRDGPLLSPAFQLNDDILLQDIVVAKGFISGVKQVQVLECRTVKHQLTKRSVIRAVAETTGNDRNQLPILFQQL